MNSGLQLPSRLVACSTFTFVFLSITLCGFAEDPIVVHYSDPSLARMEAQLAITQTQKARFEDIVVKYRDPQSNTDTDSSTQETPRVGRHGGSRRSTQGEAEIPSQREAGAPLQRAKAKVSREELDELATILTPAQIKKFQELNGATGKKRHPS
jgi:Spy/CpxP family protein refolding chaperone